MIQIIPTVSLSICHFKMKISGKKKGKLEVLMISCALIQPFHAHLLGIFYVSGVGNVEKKIKDSYLLELTFLMGKIVTNNDCSISPALRGQNL